MSGHSKWATIHRQKEVADQKKGQAFTKVANAVTLAVKESGGTTDPNSNFKLRLAMEKARAINMPKEKVQKAIDRVLGKTEGGELVEIIYEGYAPGGVGVLVETLTDNRQRTVQEVKNLFDRSGGSIASPGAVSFNFRPAGLLDVAYPGEKEAAILKLIDLGAEEVEEDEGALSVYVSPESLETVKEKLALAGLTVRKAELIMKPLNLVSVADEKTARQVLALLDNLEELDDVQRVSANFDIPEKYLKP